MPLRQTTKDGRPLWAAVPHALLTPAALEAAGPALPLLLCLLARAPARLPPLAAVGGWYGAPARTARRHLARLRAAGMVDAAGCPQPSLLAGLPRPKMAAPPGQKWPLATAQVASLQGPGAGLRRKTRREDKEARGAGSLSHVVEALAATGEELRQRRVGAAEARAIVLAVRHAVRVLRAPPGVVRACVARYLELGPAAVRPSPYAYLAVAIPRAARDRIDAAMDAGERAKVARLRR